MTKIPTQNFIEDICNKDFFMRTLPLKPDRFGKSNATLVYKPSETNSIKAVLYIHGFIDYFFQWELAEFYNKLGYNFFAVDLRRYGRSLDNAQKPNIINAVEDYYEEINAALQIMKNELGNEYIIINGHSTGGLIASLYANDFPKKIDALILNSPFFEFNVSAIEKFVLLPVIKLLHNLIPEKGMDSLTEVYPKSLSKDHYGEWDFNLTWKPIENFPAFFAWLHAIRNGHLRVQKGLNIKVPILVLFSDKSYKGKKYSAEAQICDSVLDVNDIRKYSDNLGVNITKIEIKNGMHDLILSKKDVREEVYHQMKIWMQI